MPRKTEQNQYPRNNRWRWGAVATLSMMILSLYPQVHFWVLRGSEWNGSYAAIEGVGDEIAYSAYVNALIDGRPRRNDPYTGRDSSNDGKKTDSLFSIQFVPAYLIALPARLLGLSAATAFIFLSPLAAGASALALFWLLRLATGEERVAAAGVVIVLCLGTLVAGHGHFSSFFGQQPLYNYLMFLRRYQPAAAFPFYILFSGLVWLSITIQNKARALIAASGAALIFGVLVFSYVYLWTAAAGWTISVALLWALARPTGWRDSWRPFGLIAVGALVAVGCFAVSYSNRAATLDSVQALELSHSPDLFRVPELIGFGILIALGYCWQRGSIEVRNQRVLLAVSFALLPLVVFNQQVLTGRSLQPLHYEMFVANYSVLIAAIVALGTVFNQHEKLQIKIPRKALLWIALAAFEWGAYETLVAARGSMNLGHELDDARPVALRLAELAKQEPRNETYPTLLSTDLLVADSLPTSAPQSVLWAPHMLVFSGASHVESKERFYQYLYYTGISSEQLRSILKTEGRYGFAVGLFGFERTIRGLSRNPRPITDEELETELKLYSAYSSSFSAVEASKIKISYIIARADRQVSLANFDQWYERDKGEHVGKFVLFRSRLRQAKSTFESSTSANHE